MNYINCIKRIKNSIHLAMCYTAIVFLGSAVMCHYLGLITTSSLISELLLLRQSGVTRLFLLLLVFFVAESGGNRLNEFMLKEYQIVS